jgi:hypothetical protein
MATKSEIRAPKITRDRISRPNSSVPNQCAAEGELRRCERLIAAGSAGARCGAKIAALTNTNSTTTPKSASGCRLQRVQTLEGAETSGMAMVGVLKKESSHSCGSGSGLSNDRLRDPWRPENFLDRNFLSQNFLRHPG